MLSADRLSTLATYDQYTGDITWLPRTPDMFLCRANERTRVCARFNKLWAGKVAGHKNSMGYIVLNINQKTIQAHRAAWALHCGSWPFGQIDHENGNRSDNRIENLRDVTSGENAKNRCIHSNNTSGYMGVHFHKRSGKWHARIMESRVRSHLGSFDTEEDAAAAYVECAKKMNFHENHGRKS